MRCVERASDEEMYVSDDSARSPGEDLCASDEGACASLEERLRERIRREGALSFREWMSAALYDERGGYYCRRGAERWGRTGDYRTSPERSTLFAATFARHFAKLFDELGRPPVLHIIEAGGGAGHFACGILKTLRRDFPELYNSVRYVFDEASEDARALASSALAPFAGRVEFRRMQRDTRMQDEPRTMDKTRALDAVIVFSNELIDALPVHRVLMRGGRLREMYVGVGEEGSFVWVEDEPSTPLLVEHFERLGATLVEGQCAEVNLEAEEWMRRACETVGRGFVITVDYGEEARALLDASRRPAGSLRAFRGHEFVEDLLANPGGQDLTTTVNWTQLISAGEADGLRASKLERLDAFLLNAGALEQLARECSHAACEADASRLRLEAREMILPGGMASSFQVLVQSKL